MNDETRARLAEDAMALEAALGERFDEAARSALAAVLMGAQRAHGDCALDIVIEERETRVRVAIQLAAQAAGYRRPWPREGVGAR